MPEIDLNQLQLNTLKRYKKHYKIPSKPTMNKTQLAEVCFVYLFLLHSHKDLEYYFNIFFPDINETFKDYTCSRKRNINIFYIYGKIKQQQIRSEKWSI